MYRLELFSQEPIPEGCAHLWWMGQMGFMMKFGNTMLSLDYFASPREDRQVPPPIPAREVSGLDVIIGTHNHLDHIDHESWRIWKDTCPKAVFVFPARHLSDVLADGIRRERCIPLNAGESAVVGDVCIHAIAAAHEFLDQDADTGFFAALQYIVEGNGIKVYHAGDTLRYEGMLALLKAFSPLQAAILPINGRDGERYRRNCIGNMTFQEAADLAGEVRPGLVIPGHWDMFSGNSENPYAFLDYLEAKYKGLVPCRIPEYAKLIKLSI